jgi:hypothetical protein
MISLDKNELIADVEELGYEIITIDDLMKIDKDNHDIIPIIQKHLSKVTDEGDKQLLVRCLGLRGFTDVSNTLINEFNTASSEGYKWVIGNSLSIIQDKSAVEDMVGIASNKEHGYTRQMVVVVLGKLKVKQAIPLLIELLKDEDVSGHSLMALSYFNDPSLIQYIEPLTTHKVTWIRNEAKKAIKKLEKTVRKA